MYELEGVSLGDVISFTVYPSSILGTGFNNVKVLAILDADSAKQWIDPYAQHANVFPTLPNGSLDDPEAYYYLKVKLANGAVTCVGIPWIKNETITIHTESTVQITIENVSPSDIPNIKLALTSNGFHSLEIKTV